MKRRTSFGTMESLLEKDGHIAAEVLVFGKEGRSYKHPLWEICYNPEGKVLLLMAINANKCIKALSVKHRSIPIIG